MTSLQGIQVRLGERFRPPEKVSLPLGYKEPNPSSALNATQVSISNHLNFKIQSSFFVFIAMAEFWAVCTGIGISFWGIYGSKFADDQIPKQKEAVQMFMTSAYQQRCSLCKGFYTQQSLEFKMISSVSLL